MQYRRRCRSDSESRPGLRAELRDLDDLLAAELGVAGGRLDAVDDSLAGIGLLLGVVVRTGGIIALADGEVALVEGCGEVDDRLDLVSVDRDVPVHQIRDDLRHVPSSSGGHRREGVADHRAEAAGRVAVRGGQSPGGGGVGVVTADASQVLDDLVNRCAGGGGADVALDQGRDGLEGGSLRGVRDVRIVEEPVQPCVENPDLVEDVLLAVSDDLLLVRLAGGGIDGHGVLPDCSSARMRVVGVLS